RAELDQTRAAAEKPSDITRARFQNAVLGARRIIFRQLANPIEQPRAFGIVEELARQPFAISRQTFEHRRAELLVGGLEILQPLQGLRAPHHTSSAKRTP